MGGAGVISGTFTHDRDATTTKSRMKQRPDLCTSDVISVLETLQETEKRVLKGDVDKASMASLLSALISSNTGIGQM